MENNNKPNELIFPLTVAHYSEYSEVQSIRNGNHVFSLMHDNQGDRIQIASAILTACNDYKALKQQNEEYGAMLKTLKEIHETESDIHVQVGSKISASFHSNIADKITELLTKYQK